MVSFPKLLSALWYHVHVQKFSSTVMLLGVRITNLKLRNSVPPASLHSRQHLSVQDTCTSVWAAINRGSQNSPVDTISCQSGSQHTGRHLIVRNFEFSQRLQVRGQMHSYRGEALQSSWAQVLLFLRDGTSYLLGWCMWSSTDNLSKHCPSRYFIMILQCGMIN